MKATTGELVAQLSRSGDARLLMVGATQSMSGPPAADTENHAG
ncbi:MAG: hypothetical protein ACR2MZ_11800 [Candidatus Dormibacter sp.]